jgi:translation initiation factor IF-3
MIRVPKVRVISPDGEQLGILEIRDALRRATEDYGLDLIEVSPNSEPPVCRIMDLGKFKYQQKKKEHESKKKQTVILLKEIKLTTKTEEHDLEFKVRHIERFLSDGNKAKVTVKFKGREMANIQLGRAMLDKVLEQIGDKGIVEQPPKIEGKNMFMIVAPKQGA